MGDIMKKVRILEANDNSYILVSSDGKQYEKSIEFYNVEAPKVGDLLYLSDKILNDVNIYCFGPFEENLKNINEDDIIKIVSSNQEYYLQRYYG